MREYPDWFINELVDSSDKERALSGELKSYDRVKLRCLKCGYERVSYVRNRIRVGDMTEAWGCKGCSCSSGKVYCKKKTVSEYIAQYPNKSYLFDKHTTPRFHDPRGVSDRRGINYMCDKCGKLIWVEPKNLAQDARGDGTYFCKKCNAHEAQVKRYKNMTSERRSEIVRKGYLKRLEGGYPFRSPQEPIIDHIYGSVHMPIVNSCFDYELDCYWPDKKLAVEIDDPSHYECKDNKFSTQRPQGLHRKKDDYFKEQGITVLHLTTRYCEENEDWLDRVKEFLDGVYTGPLIDLEDPIYGDIIY